MSKKVSSRRPGAKQPGDRKVRNIVIGGIIALVVIGLGALLYLNVQEPESLAGLQRIVGLERTHDEEVVYLRVRATELQTEESLSAAIEADSEDAVGACLGLELTPLEALSDVPEVLTAKWVSRVEDTNDMQRLSVREEQLRRAIDRELPALAEHVPADYFLLLVVQGQSRLEDPVDVFVWDLDSDALVLRSRTENRGKLITVRSQIGPNADSASAEGDPVAVADCSIAAHIKAQLGEPTMDLGAD